MQISIQVIGPTLLLLSKIESLVFLVFLNRKKSEEYPVNVCFPQSSLLDLTIFLQYTDIVTFLMFLSVIFAINADDTTLNSKCDQGSDLGQQTGFASELE